MYLRSRICDSSCSFFGVCLQRKAALEVEVWRIVWVILRDECKGLAQHTPVGEYAFLVDHDDTAHKHEGEAAVAMRSITRRVNDNRDFVLLRIDLRRQVSKQARGW